MKRQNNIFKTNELIKNQSLNSCKILNLNNIFFFVRPHPLQNNDQTDKGGVHG